MGTRRARVVLGAAVIIGAAFLLSIAALHPSVVAAVVATGYPALPHVTGASFDAASTLLPAAETSPLPATPTPSASTAPQYHLGLFDPDIEQDGQLWDRKLFQRNEGKVVFEEWVAKHNQQGPVAARGSTFVSIASYRDEECFGTLLDMYEKAEWPEGLFVGIVDQRAVGVGVTGVNATQEKGDVPDRPCFDAAAVCTFQHLVALEHAAGLSRLCRLRGNVRIAHVPRSMARGPTFGRFVANMMRRNESYFMMIDSHSRATPGWDHKMKAQLHTLIKLHKKPQIVLSTYPDAWRNPADGGLDSMPPNGVPPTTLPAHMLPQHQYEGRNMTTYLCEAKFLQTGILRLQGVMVPVLRNIIARPQPWASAGFLFGPAALVDSTPFDPFLDYLFDGEEILYSIRLWTSGWDFYSPGESIIFHYYYRRRSHKIFGDAAGWQAEQLRSIHRVQHILKLHPVAKNMLSWTKVDGVPSPAPGSRVFHEVDKYGLGKVRSLTAYWQFAGADPVQRKMKKDWCRQFYFGGGA